MTHAPLIAIVGATGTGKSKLAVDIARRYNGEIINGDAMQLYQGLPIITNKIPEDERHGIPHHLLGYISLSEQPWTVGKFVSSALSTIKEIRSRDKLPILVGGTHYYTQALLFHDSLIKTPDGDLQGMSDDSREHWPILDASAEDMHVELRRVDPVMAARWHPNDHRKIRRSLEIYLQTGRKASDIYREQREQTQSSQSLTNGSENHAEDQPSSKLRTNTLVLWVHADLPILSERLAIRVDKMVEQGLSDEVKALSEYASTEAMAGHTLDTSSGIWVSIGYKEFLDHQRAVEEGQSEKEISVSLQQGIKKTKIATRQYAKRQFRWIRIKLNHAMKASGTRNNFFVLDGSDLSQWQASIDNPAMDLVDSFLKGQALPDPSSICAQASELLQQSRQNMNTESWKRQYCDACNVTAVTESDWTQHVKSKKHKYFLTKAKQQQQQAVQDGQSPTDTKAGTITGESNAET